MLPYLAALVDEGGTSASSEASAAAGKTKPPRCDMPSGVRAYGNLDS